MRAKVTLATIGEVIFLLLPAAVMLVAGLPVPELLATYALAYGIPALALLATTVYLHRHLTHGSVTLSPVVVLPCRALVWVASGMKPREWRGVHKRHHDKSDEPGDPHSPWQAGFWMVYLWTAGLYHKAKKTPEVLLYIDETPPDKLDRLVFDRGAWGPAFALPLVQLLVLFGLFGLGWQLASVLFTWPIAIIFYLHAGGVVNAIGHTLEEVNPETKDYSKNLIWLFRLVTLGEASHHNHHLDKGSAKFNKHWWKDPGWMCICILRPFGLVTVNHVRPEWK
jgi:stearoyl-CoA desaturase (delta-9 desaturase)